MDTYTPSDKLTKATLAAILAPVPLVAGYAIKIIPLSLKERGVSMALSHAIPLALGSIALAHGKGAHVPLTRHGALTEEAKTGLVKRIALWFVPDEVKAVTAALNEDITRLAEGKYETGSIRLEIENDDVVLIVLNTSLIRQSADTAFDLFFASSEKLAGLKELVLRYVPARA